MARSKPRARPAGNIAARGGEMFCAAAEPIGRRRLRLLLASSSLAALLVGGGAPAALACYTGPFAGGYTNSVATACITVNNTSFSGILGNTGTISPGPTGIAVVNNSTITGTISDSGTISASGHGILIDSTSQIANSSGTAIRISGPTFVGGISNSGNIAAGGSASAVININSLSTFAGGISNSGTITSASLAGIIISNITMFTGTISNTGTISARTAINITGVSTFTGDITNSGTISAAIGDAVLLGNVSTFSGNISNSTTISAAGSGIIVNGVSSFLGAIANTGTIDAEFGSGIVVGRSNLFGGPSTISTFTGNISNSGTISAGQNGIWVGGIADGSFAQVTISAFAGGITNASSGIIDAAGDGIVVGGTALNRVSLIVSTFSGGISNAGTISAGHSGIFVGGDADIPGGNVAISIFGGGISNSGTISASAGNGIWVGGQASIPINATDITATLTISTFSGDISNGGTISAGGNGIWVGGTASISAGVDNAATVTISTFSSGISNSGTISAGGKGIFVGGTAIGSGARVTISTFAGGISNSGMISADGAGIAVGNSSGGVTISTFTGGIANSSTIAAATGIAIANVTSGGGISDSGVISASAHGILVGRLGAVTATRTGILVSGPYFAGGISNAGMITADGKGILVGGTARSGASFTLSTFSGGISNSGTISAAVQGVFVGGTVALLGAKVTISSFAGGIINSGAISADASGIFVGGAALAQGTLAISSVAGPITNSGTISAGYNGIWLGGRASGAMANVAISAFSGGISNSSVISATDKGIFVGGTAIGPGASVTISTFSGGIINSGTINARTGIVVSDVLAFSGAIANSGTISGSGGTAIDVSGAHNAMTIDQSAGLISGAIKLSVNADVLNISGGSIAGDIVGGGSSDTINFNLGNGTFTYGAAYGFIAISQVNINSGTAILDGTNNATNVDVFGGTLAGSGTLDPLTLTIHSGGTFSPGSPGIPGSFMTIAGNLAFKSGALYVVYLNPATSSFADVTGTASLDGSVSANFTAGSYVGKKYTILQSAGLGGTTFAGLTSSGLPTGFDASLSYSADDVYLNLTTALGAGTPLNPNQQNVANAITNYFDSGGTLPPAFVGLFSLSGSSVASALTQLDGEDATGAETSAFQLMNQFLDLLLDPSSGGDGSGGAGGGTLGFAPEQLALPPAIAAAYAAVLKAPPPVSYTQRWTAWGSAFGGSGTADGNAATGSNNITASDYGFAGGLDYHLDPATLYGFALAGAGTHWDLAQGLGSGRSDAFQAGLYGKHYFGPAYISGALAFANHWFSTERTALGEQLKAKFEGQSYAARFETGYRYGLPAAGEGMLAGVTPYAALQAQWLHTPSYSETDLTGGGFGLSYNAMNANDTRSELGARFDDLTMFNAMPLILRGRLAWAHDWVSNPALGAAFQALPGSSFIVNGAPIPHDSALTTVGAELHLTAHWSALAKFDGDFASGAQTYAGTATLRYSW